MNTFSSILIHQSVQNKWDQVPDACYMLSDEKQLQCENLHKAGSLWTCEWNKRCGESTVCSHWLYNLHAIQLLIVKSEAVFQCLRKGIPNSTHIDNTKLVSSFHLTFPSFLRLALNSQSSWHWVLTHRLVWPCPALILFKHLYLKLRHCSISISLRSHIRRFEV